VYCLRFIHLTRFITRWCRVFTAELITLIFSHESVFIFCNIYGHSSLLDVDECVCSVVNWSVECANFTLRNAGHSVHSLPPAPRIYRLDDLDLIPNISRTFLCLHNLRDLRMGSFIHQWLYSPLLGPGLFFSFVIIFTQTVGLLGWGISPSQGRYLRTGQHRYPCFEWDSNPRSQPSSERRQFMP
jgi:hypothetical protein